MTSPRGSGHWIASRRFDLLWFIGPGFFSLLLVAPVITGHWRISEVSPIAWLLLVVLVDVAHVWSTLFRTYLDGEERRRRPLLYWGLPFVVFVVGYLVHSAKPAWFWTGLAYIAVFHFIRQQYGFVSLYRGRAGERRLWVRRFDQLVVYIGTGVPILYWHVGLPRNIAWFVEGDFIGPLPQGVMDIAWPVYCVVGVLWVAHRLMEVRASGPQWGRDLTMLATWLTWYTGIVLTDLDFVFTATNVLIHGVPYTALVWWSARRNTSKTAPLRRFPWWLLLVTCAGCAIIEEWLWDLTVWNERAYWFGSLPDTIQGGWIVDLAVPLLMVPQATHYLLDRYIWKMDGSNPGLKARIFVGEPQTLG